jgi:hypothetical protein
MSAADGGGGGSRRKTISLRSRRRSERREMDEQNDEEQREQRSKNATEQPEMAPSQNEQPGPARPAGWRQTRFLRTENVCSHWAPRGVSILRHHYCRCCSSTSGHSSSSPSGRRDASIDNSVKLTSKTVCRRPLRRANAGIGEQLRDSCAWRRNVDFDDACHLYSGSKHREVPSRGDHSTSSDILHS